MTIPGISGSTRSISAGTRAESFNFLVALLDDGFTAITANKGSAVSAYTDYLGRSEEVLATRLTRSLKIAVVVNMVAPVFQLAHNNKITNLVISPITVKMMYFFAGVKSSANMLLNNITMFFDSAAPYTNDLIALTIRATFKGWVIRTKDTLKRVFSKNQRSAFTSTALRAELKSIKSVLGEINFFTAHLARFVFTISRGHATNYTLQGLK